MRVTAQTAADRAEPFAAGFALLTSLAARGLVLKVTAPDGIGGGLRNDYEAVEGQALTWKPPTRRRRASPRRRGPPRSSRPWAGSSADATSGSRARKACSRGAR
jgi:hypothetical protein